MKVLLIGVNHEENFTFSRYFEENENHKEYFDFMRKESGSDVLDEVLVVHSDLTLESIIGTGYPSEYDERRRFFPS